MGDALLLGHSTTGNAQLVWVEEIALVNCVVRRWDGARIWWPNVLLDSYPLVNLSRSNNKWESVEVGPLPGGGTGYMIERGGGWSSPTTSGSLWR